MAFAWKPPASTETAPITEKIEPSEILYDFDGPLLFASNAASFPVLCYKFDDSEKSALYLMVQTNGDIINRLKDGRISLRGAMSQPWTWVAEVDENFSVRKSWGLSFGSLPEAILPEPGHGISYSQGIIREGPSVAENPFLSIHFKGGELRGNTLPFGVVKKLFDDVYESIWKIFSPGVQESAPNASEKALRKSFSVPTYAPAFSSLLITIERPTFDFTHMKNVPEVDVQRARRNIERAHSEFLTSAETVASLAARGRLSAAFSSEHIDAIEAVAQLAPGQTSFFDTLEINGKRAGKKETGFSIDAKSGDAIRDAYQISMSSKRTINGNIVEINARSSTFIVKTPSFREVTCIARAGAIQEAIPGLRTGMPVAVVGYYKKRTRRDIVWIDTLTAQGHVYRA